MVLSLLDSAASLLRQGYYREEVRPLQEKMPEKYIFPHQYRPAFPDVSRAAQKSPEASLLFGKPPGLVHRD